MKIKGTKEPDTLDGTAAADVILGKKGDDHLSGGSGDDVIKGGRGDDDIWGGQGADKLWGGKGADTFNFVIGPDGQPPDFQIDKIKDFAPGEDKIVLHFIGPASSVVASLSYDADNGRVSVHHDGAEPQTYAIAKIGKGLVLDADDLVIA